jgi:hypothetical protein
MDPVMALRREQDGVVARRQLLALPGMDRTGVARLLRRGELLEVHRGVYVDHTGRLTWQQQAWAAVLWAWPAALGGESALRAFEGPGRRSRDTGRIHVLVERERRLSPPERVVVHRREGFSVQWNLGPPRTRIEQAVLDVALAAPDRLAAVAALADASGSRRTTAARLRAALDARAWVPHRDWLVAVLDDVAAGTCSVLEQEYLSGVERAHGLPLGLRQTRASHAGRTMWQDVRYEEWGLVVELDGRLDHTAAADRDRDLDRDLAAAAAGEQTLRLGWGQVVDRACATAELVAQVLSARGGPGRTQPCEKCGALDQAG